MKQVLVKALYSTSSYTIDNTLYLLSMQTSTIISIAWKRAPAGAG